MGVGERFGIDVGVRSCTGSGSGETVRSRIGKHVAGPRFGMSTRSGSAGSSVVEVELGTTVRDCSGTLLCATAGSGVGRGVVGTTWCSGTPVISKVVACSSLGAGA